MKVISEWFHRRTQRFGFQPKQSIMGLIALLNIVFAGLTPSMAFADAVRAEIALKILQKGLTKCAVAHEFQATSMILAERRYREFVIYRDEAVGLQSNLLSFLNPQMKQSLAKCERQTAKTTLAVARTALKNALSECEKAYSQQQVGNHKLANKKARDYFTEKNSAVELNADVQEGYKKEIERCDRFVAVQVEPTLKIIATQDDTFISEWVQLESTCQKLLSTLQQPAITKKEFADLKPKMVEMKQKLNKLSRMTTAQSNLNSPDNIVGSDLLLAQRNVRTCEHQSARYWVATAGRLQRNEMHAQMLIHFKEALKHCQRAESIIGEEVFAERIAIKEKEIVKFLLLAKKEEMSGRSVQDATEHKIQRSTATKSLIEELSTTHQNCYQSVQEKLATAIAVVSSSSVSVAEGDARKLK